MIDSDGFKRTVQYIADSVNSFNAVVNCEPLAVRAVVAPDVFKTVAPAAHYTSPTVERTVAPIAHYATRSVVKTFTPVAYYATPTTYIAHH